MRGVRQWEMMFSAGMPPLPPGQPPGQVQQVVPPEMPVQPLWQNGMQLRQHLRELVQRASLLKSLAAELQAFEFLKTKTSSSIDQPNVDEIKIESLSNSTSPPHSSEERASRLVDETLTAGPRIVPQVNLLSTTETRRCPDGSIAVEDLCDKPSGNTSNVDILGVDHTFPHADLLTAIHSSRRTEMEALEAASDLQGQVKNLLEPLQGALGAPGGWEHAVAAARLKSKREKIERNRRWRKRKRQRIAEARRNEQEGFEEADRKADEWRAREIARAIARSKMEKMKEVAERKAKEERARLEAELEMVLMVEKLQELRTLRIQKLKKQGRFFPDEDDKFIERVRAAVEEEERQAVAAADTRAAAAAIASAAVAAKATGSSSTNVQSADGEDVLEDQRTKADEPAADILIHDTIGRKVDDGEVLNTSSGMKDAEEERKADVQETYRLPAEFYHFYHGSQVDMGALVEVRQAWDAFLRPGGSRIPGNWIEAPPPADAVWASYLVQPTLKRHRAGEGGRGTNLKKRMKK